MRGHANPAPRRSGQGRAPGVMRGLRLLAGLAVTLSFFALRNASRLPARKVAAGKELPDASGTSLAAAARRQTKDHPNLSGLHLLESGIDACAARLALVKAAESRLDVQYYIWHGDRTGTLLLQAIHEAAERGVKVRMLLDDNGISGLDTALAALDQHPGVEIRIFNPFAIRFPKALGFLFDFKRLNRRMHNKSLTVDGSVTIVGGRNIGDEYFDADDEAMFVDLDVLAIGPAVAAVEEDFQRYWDSQSAYPAHQILPRVRASQRRKLAKRAAAVSRDDSARRYIGRLNELSLVDDLRNGALALEWAEVRLVSDDPAKTLGKAEQRDLLLTNLQGLMGPVRREIGLVSGYFVPGAQGAETFADLAASGISITILTNGYAASDVGLVHAGYAPHRKRLVSAGVRLLEIQPWPTSPGTAQKTNHVGIAKRFRGTGTGSTAALRSGVTTLHAKTFTVDRERLFVGSFNLDPRSYELNTELGFVIESPAFATRVADRLEEAVKGPVCEVVMGADGELRWKFVAEDVSLELDAEPGMTALDRLIVGIARRLPIARLL
ncbi:phospholipase D family protein [Aurantiacibacter flavus]|uniref:Phospholipase D n=1 Tax=Aurantiacibacter flavus TaxID=3145232 RepID=A0ABV0D325_9SPHN